MSVEWWIIICTKCCTPCCCHFRSLCYRSIIIHKSKIIHKTVAFHLNPHKCVEISITIGGSRGGREGRTPPPGRPNSFDFMQFSGKFGVFTPPLEGSRPPLGKILDPPLITYLKFRKSKYVNLLPTFYDIIHVTGSN